MLSRLGPPLALAMALASAARAADWYTGALVAEVVTPPPPTISIDASLDVTSRSSLVGALIGKIAPFGSLVESGPRLRASVVVGTYAYNASDLTAFTPADGQFIPATSGYGRVHGTLEDGSRRPGRSSLSHPSSPADAAISRRSSTRPVTPGRPRALRPHASTRACRRRPTPDPRPAGDGAALVFFHHQDTKGAKPKLESVALPLRSPVPPD